MDLLKSVLRTICTSQNLLNVDLKKAQIGPILGKSDPIWGQHWNPWSPLSTKQPSPTTYKGISDSVYFCTDWHQVQQIVKHKVGVRVGLGVGDWVADRVAVWVGVGVGVWVGVKGGVGVGVVVGE